MGCAMSPPQKSKVLRASSKARRDFGLLRTVLLVLPQAEAQAATEAFAVAAPECTLIAVSTVDEALSLVQEGPVSVVVGSAEPQGKSLAGTLSEVIDVPVVVLVDEGDERQAMRAIADGALDWVARSDSVAEALPHIALGAVREWREFGLRRAAEEQLRHADRLALVGRVAAGVVHEVGTPLNVVRMRAQLLQMDPGHLREATEVIVEQCDRIAEMLQSTLVLARRNSGKRQPVDLADVARRAASLLAPTLGRRHVTSQVEGDSAVTLGNRGEILQVVLNLMTNAMDAMPEGGRIDVLTTVRDGLATLSVRDSGVGVAPEHLPHLFAPFFTTKEPGRGTGLGLSVCAEVAREHGGRITVASVPGRGTTFVVELPLHN